VHVQAAPTAADDGGTTTTTTTISNVVAPRQSEGGGPALVYKGNTAWPYGLCEGDCDSDSDCSAGLTCHQRSGTSAVPGCTGGGGGDRSDVDYCVGTGANANGNELTAVAGDLDSTAQLLRRCEADCDDDDECAAGLMCYQRDDAEPVPGCNGTPRDGWDYCVRPSDVVLLELLLDTDEPTARPTMSLGGEEETTTTTSPTTSPTQRPSVRPTMPPPGVVFSFPEGSEPKDMQRCRGDCDKDSDCASGLVCLLRNGKSPDDVPGCRGKADGGDDYCISPADLPPTPSPTPEPSLGPTTRPTMAPTWSPVTSVPTPKPVVQTQPTTTTVRATPRPTNAPFLAPSTTEAAAADADNEEEEEDSWLDMTPTVGGGDDADGGGGQEQLDSADTMEWVYLSPFELSLDFQTISNRRRKLLRASTTATTITTTITAAASAAAGHTPALRHLQQLSSLIDTAQIEDVLGDIIGNTMGALSTGYSEVDLDIALRDEETYDDGRITVTYDVEGNVGFDTVDGDVPTEERVRRTAERAVQEDVLVRDLRRLGDDDLVLSSVQSTRVSFLEPANPFGGNTGGLDPTKQPASNGGGKNNTLVEILVLVIIVVVCIGATALAVLFVRKRRKEKAFKRDIERNRSKMEQERSGEYGGRESKGGKSGTPTKSPGPGKMKSSTTNTPPAKAFQGQRPPPQSTPPTPALTPPVGTISVKKSRSLPQSRSASTKKQLFVKDTPATSKLRKKTKKDKFTDGNSAMPDPPESDIEGGDWSVSVTGMADTGMDRARSMPLNSGLASLTSMENIDTDIDDADDTLGDANEDNTVSSLGGESLTFGGTAAGESIFGKDGIRLDAVLRLDEERSQSSMSELGEGSFGNRPRYRDRAAAASKKKSKVANKKKRGPPPQPSAAAQDLEGQVKAFEERVLGLSAQEEQNLPARLRSDHV